MLPTALLTLPPPGDRTFATLDRKVRLLTLEALLRADPHRLEPELARALPRVQALVKETARRHRGALLEALAVPDVRAPLLVLRGGLGPPGTLLRTAVPALLLALSERSALPETVFWPGPVESLIAQDRGLYRRWDPPAAALVVGPEGVEVRTETGIERVLGADDRQAQAPFTPIRDGLWLAEVDTNPLAEVEAHPDKDGNTIDLGGHSAEAWADRLRAALAPVEALLPSWTAELPLSQHRVVPVGFEPERHLSATYREAPGTCYLSLHPEPLTLAEALVHETQHSKLSVALHLDALLVNGRSAWTASPVRPDLRPLEGVLLAVHAFVPVAALHARLRAAGHPWSHRPGFDRRMREVLAGNARGLDTLERLGRPTALGGRLLRDLRRLHDATAARVPDLEVAADAVPPG